jgi:hypothetical protein
MNQSDICGQDGPIWQPQSSVPGPGSSDLHSPQPVGMNCGLSVTPLHAAPRVRTAFLEDTGSAQK